MSYISNDLKAGYTNKVRKQTRKKLCHTKSNSKLVKVNIKTKYCLCKRKKREKNGKKST